MRLALNHTQRQVALALVIPSGTSQSLSKMGTAEELLGEDIPAEVVEAVRCLTKPEQFSINQNLKPDEISFPSIRLERKI